MRKTGKWEEAKDERASVLKNLLDKKQDIYLKPKSLDRTKSREESAIG